MNKGIQRAPAYQRNETLEDFLRTLNDELARAERAIDTEMCCPRFPPLFLASPPRSGSTLFSQWIAAQGLWAYPTNFLSRFYRAPAIGAKVQALLSKPDLQFRHEFEARVYQPTFCSDQGKTEGILAPHEFWHFWRQFLPDPQRTFLSASEKRLFPNDAFALSMARWESVENRPLFMKCILFNENLDLLARIFDHAIFIHLKRDPVANCLSLLKTRQQHFGCLNAWYSFPISPIGRLQHLPPLDQVAHQVTFLNWVIDRQLIQFAPGRTLTVSYEGFCRDPDGIYNEIRRLYAAAGHEFPEIPPFRACFPQPISERDAKLEDEIRSALISAQYHYADSTQNKIDEKVTYSWPRP